MSMEFKGLIPDAHLKNILSIAINTARREIFTGSEEFNIKVWEGETGKLLNVFTGHKGPVTCLYYNKDIKILFSGSMDGCVIAWSPSGKILQKMENGRVRVLQLVNWDDILAVGEIMESKSYVCLEHSDIVRCVLHCDGRFYSAGYDRKLVVYNSPSHSDPRLRVLNFVSDAHDAAVTCMVHAKDSENSWIITASFDRVIKLWSTDGVLWQKFDGFAETISSICYVPPTQTLWISAAVGPPVIFDPRNGVNITDFVHHDSLNDNKILNRGGTRFRIKTMLFVPETNEILAFTSRKAVLVWKYNNHANITVLRGHTDIIETIAHTTKEPILLFSGGADGLIRRWERLELNPFMYSQEPLPLAKAKVKMELYEEDHYFRNTLQENPELRRKLQVELHKHVHRKIQIWRSHADVLRLDPLEQKQRWQDVISKQMGLMTTQALETYNVRERILAKTAEKSGVYMYNKEEEEEELVAANAKVHKQSTLCSVYYEPMDILLTSNEDATIVVWGYGRENETFVDGLKDKVKSTESLQETTELGVESFTNRISGLTQKTTLKEHKEAVTALTCFQRDGVHYMLSSGWDRRLVLWNLNTLEMQDVFRNPDQPGSKEELAADGVIYDLDYCKERNEFAYASADRCAYVRRFNPDGGRMQLQAVLQGHENEVTCIRWNPIHRQWVTGSEDCTVRIWSQEGIPCVRVIHNEGPVSALCIDMLNGCVITGSSDRAIRVYDPTKDEAIVQKHLGHADAVRSVVHIAIRHQYVSASWDRTLRTWNAYYKQGQRKYLGQVLKTDSAMQLQQQVPSSTASSTFLLAQGAPQMEETSAVAALTSLPPRPRVLPATVHLASSRSDDELDTHGDGYSKDDTLERKLYDDGMKKTLEQVQALSLHHQ